MIKNTLITLLLPMGFASCQEVSHPLKLTLKVVDDAGAPIADAKVGSSTFVRWESGEGFGRDVWEGPGLQVTDLQGKATFEYLSKTGEVGVGVGPKQGFYSSSFPNYKFKEVVAGRWTPENPEITCVLKRKINPIPLYAKNLKEGLLVPVLGEKCGYDFQAGDWTAPHGAGKNLDIFFKVTSEQQDENNFDSAVEITFPNAKDGLIFFKQNPHVGSELVSDHNAPAEGYQPGRLMRRFGVNGKITNEMDAANGNYYLRLRTSVDQDGNIKTANYAKIYGDFMYFIYYFNPTPNDRNLEFDPTRNMLGGQSVTRP